MSELSTKLATTGNVPRHVAIIMDGNGRWANSKRKPRLAGHRAGVRSVRASVETATQRGVEYLTLFAFSSENWSRPEEEVSSLMDLFVEALRREVDELHRNNVRLNFIGLLDELSSGLREKIQQSEETTANNTGLRLTVAIAYGGRWDIVEASKAVARRVLDGSLQVDEIGDAEFASGLQLSTIPDPDLLIRTGRANTTLLDHITVEYYGSQMPLNQVANIGIEDSRTLIVTPWEKDMVQPIEKAIMTSDLGLNPVSAGTVIRVPLPALTEERRKDMIRIVRNEAEGGRIAIRNIRRDALHDAKELLKEKMIGEDDERRAEGEIQDITDKHVGKIDKVLADKESDLMEV